MARRARSPDRAWQGCGRNLGNGGASNPYKLDHLVLARRATGRFFECHPQLAILILPIGQTAADLQGHGRRSVASWRTMDLARLRPILGGQEGDLADHPASDHTGPNRRSETKQKHPRVADDCRPHVTRVPPVTAPATRRILLHREVQFHSMRESTALTLPAAEGVTQEV